MKYLIASDIHGSLFYAKKLKTQIEREKPNKIVLLGDLYYHGPRNPLTKEYSPKEVANLFNSMHKKIICTRGNCDAEVDQMISKFKISSHKKIKFANKTIMFTHGHKFNIDNPPQGIDILFYGHFHTGFIKENNGQIYVNVGSIALPKNETNHSYAILDNSGIYLKTIDGEIITFYEFKQ